MKRTSTAFVENEKSVRPLGLLIAAYCALIPLEAVLVSTFGGSVQRYVGILVMLCILIWMILKGIRKPKVGIFLLALLYAAYAVLSYFWRSFYSDSNYHIILLNMAAVTFFLIQYPLTKKEWAILHHALIVIGIGLSVLLLFGNSYRVVNTVDGGRMTLAFGGVEIDNNNLATGISISAVISLYYALKDDQKILARILYLVPVAVISYAVFLTGSRGGLIAEVAGFAALLLMVLRKLDLKRAILLVFVVFVVGYLVARFLPGSIRSRFQLASVQASGATGRFALWERTWNGFLESPLSRNLFGYGVGSAPDIIQYFGGPRLSCHNDFLQTLLELGYVGFAFYFAMLFAMAWKVIRERNFLNLALLAVMIGASFSMEMYIKKMFWMVVFFICI